KDMECAVCKRGVRLTTSDSKLDGGQTCTICSGHLPHLLVVDKCRILSFEPALQKNNNQKSSSQLNSRHDFIASSVFRKTLGRGIENTPWDITPPRIRNWLQQPVERFNILQCSIPKARLSPYVEVKDATIAGAILVKLKPGLVGLAKRNGVLCLAREGGSEALP
ncbi:hypothetical protein M378DRAFT_162702, partial [Amanita muscaria Koide BX008]